MRVWQNLRTKVALAVFVLAAAPACAANIAVSNAWVRFITPQVPAGGYFTIQNNGSSNVALVGAASPACSMLMLHKSSSDNGMARMQMIDSVDVPAGKSVSFAPNGLHLMCEAPTAAVKVGASIPIDLHFSDKTTLRVPFAVKNAAGR